MTSLPHAAHLLVLAAVLYALLDPAEELALPRRVLGAAAALSLSAAILAWALASRVYGEAFPLELPASRALALQAACALLAAAAFGLLRGARACGAGAVYGLAIAAVGWRASRWPQLARAVELSGGVFSGLLLAALLKTALAATAAGLAAVLLRPRLRPRAPVLFLAAVGIWAGATLAMETLMSRVWGYGPRSLAEAAGVPTNASSERLAVAWLAPSRGRAYRLEPRRMSSETTDLSARSLDKLSRFLARARLRGVFASEGLAALRLGRLQRWEAEEALDAMMLAEPGRAAPDYARALDLLRAGPLTAERYAKLTRLEASAKASSEGFETVSGSQAIFEGFSAAYARFGDDAKADEWFARIRNLWAVSERKPEGAATERFRTGRVEGSLFLDGRPAAGVRVGLFYVWKSSATAVERRLLAGSAFPDEDGRFAFDDLGAGRYLLALLASPRDLGGRILGSSGFIDVDEERPEIALPPVRLERETSPVPEAFAPGGLPEAPIPIVPEPPIFRPRR